MNSIHDPIQEITEDVLERSGLADAVFNRLNSADCPSVLGVYGGWGSGKSSLINLLCQLNKEQDPKQLHIEIIDAWKYDTGASLLIPIIIRLKKMIGYADLPDSWRTITKRILATTTFSVADSLLKKFTEIDSKTIMANYAEAEKRDRLKDHSSVLLEWEQWSDDVEETAEAFRTIVNCALEQIGCKRIILCIDNLDRCSPDNAVRLLESVKTFFSVPNCVWVFVVDNDVIASYIDQKYKGTKIDGHSYLDKIITEQYHIPSLNGIYTRDLLKRLDVEFEPGVELSQLGNLLTPRRILKAAIKFRQFYDIVDEKPNRSTSERLQERKVIFSLIFLYFAWPDFYKFLSSDTPEHIEGVLRNYLPTSVQSGDGDGKIPLQDEFKKEELTYFIQTAILQSGIDWKGTVLNMMISLRRVGLP